MLSIIGHDPGVTGGLVHTTDGEALAWLKVPMIAKRVDVAAVTEWLSACGGVDIFMSEKVWGFPGDTPTTAWSFSSAESAVIACATLLELPIHYATPQQWQKAILQGVPTKTRNQRIAGTFAFAREQNPAMSGVLEKKSNDGLASAACLAEYARRLKRARRI